MARQPRPRTAGLTLHVMQRGNNKSDLFRSKHDYELFHATLAEACNTHQMTVNGYALMTNHVHLVLTPQTDDALSLTMQAIGRRYVYYFNKEYGRTGGLFEGRYRSLIINTEVYWFRCMRYVELNPVRAGLTDRPEDYQWSSHRSHALGARDQLLSHHALYLSLGDSDPARQTAWRQICRDALPDDQVTELRKMVHRGTTVRRRPQRGFDPGYEL